MAAFVTIWHRDAFTSLAGRLMEVDSIFELARRWIWLDLRLNRGDHEIPSRNRTSLGESGDVQFFCRLPASCPWLYTVIAKLGFTNVSIAVTETGWPHGGDVYEVGPSLLSSKMFISNLVQRLVANAGAPLRPDVPIEGFIFDLFDENLKDGAGSENHFGLFYANGTPIVNVGIVPPQDPLSATLPLQ